MKEIKENEIDLEEGSMTKGMHSGACWLATWALLGEYNM